MSSVLAKRRLIPHPGFPCAAVDGIEVTATAGRDGMVMLDYVVIGRIADLRLSPLAAPERTDELWRHSCFEAFLAMGVGYLEYNFSPSSQWAAYRFEGYRDGRRDAEVAAPAIEAVAESGRFSLGAKLAFPAGAGAVGLSAVIEEASGGKSYWALAHPPGRPDFHHQDCFVLELAAAMRA